MEINGWRSVDFKNQDDFEEWVNSRPPAHEYDARVAHIVTHGLPAMLKVVREEHFLRIDLEPLDGWVWLANDESTRKEMEKGWVPHISLTKWRVDEGAYQRVLERYDGTKTIIKVSSVSSGAAAVLAWEGVGGDPDLWALYVTGDFSYKWELNKFGLHISL